MVVPIRSLVNARSLQLECDRVTVVTYGSETTIWREKERSKIRAVQVNNLRGLLDICRKDKVPNSPIRQLCGLTKDVVDEKIEEGVLRWFGHMERMEKDRIGMRVYVGECAGIRSVGRPRKRWTDT